MSTWMYEYRKLIAEIDLLQEQQGNKQSKAVWTSVKSRMRRVADELVQESVLSREEALPTVWYVFEERMSSDDKRFDDDYVREIDEIMWDYVLSAPAGREGEWTYWAEVGFSQARAFTREEGIQQQESFIEDEGGYETVYGQPRPKPRLKLITGGKDKSKTIKRKKAK